MVARSKMLAAESGRSKVSTQMSSSVRCRRMPARDTLTVAAVAGRLEPGVGGRMEVGFVVMVSDPFKPDGAALAAADAERDQRAARLASGELFEAGQDQARARGADRMPDGDGAAVDV